MKSIEVLNNVDLGFSKMYRTNTKEFLEMCFGREKTAFKSFFDGLTALLAILLAPISYVFYAFQSLGFLLNAMFITPLLCLCDIELDLSPYLTVFAITMVYSAAAVIAPFGFGYNFLQRSICPEPNAKTLAIN